MIVYLAGPYNAPTDEGIEENVRQARAAALKLWQAGHVVLSPHLNSGRMDRDAELPDAQFITGYLEMLKRCDALVLLPTWQASRGSKMEYALALERRMPIYFYPAIPPLAVRQVETAELEVLRRMAALQTVEDGQAGGVTLIRRWDGSVVDVIPDLPDQDQPLYAASSRIVGMSTSSSEVQA